MNISGMLKATMVAGALATGGAAAGIAGASAATSSSTTTTPSTPSTSSTTPPAQKAAPPKAGTGKNPCPNMGPGSSGATAPGSNSGAGYSGGGPAVSYQ